MTKEKITWEEWWTEVKMFMRILGYSDTDLELMSDAYKENYFDNNFTPAGAVNEEVTEASR